MKKSHLFQEAQEYLNRLCLEIPTRQVGSLGNQQATAFFAEVVSQFGFEVASSAFDCIDWTQGGADLTVNGRTFPVLPSPYSLGCQVAAPLVVVSTPAELDTAVGKKAVMLVRGELAKEQLIPKNFRFYKPKEHQRIIRLLEEKEPSAIVAATSRNPDLAGGMYPFPLFEDGDFNIPSVYMTEEVGNSLMEFSGNLASLNSRCKRIPSKGSHVIAWKGGLDRRLVFSAHIDCKIGTPGALDNAAGVIVLLLLAELLGDYRGSLGIELAPFNGEDYYASPGEILYLQQNQGKLDQILLNINIDGVGNLQGDTAYSFYQASEDLSTGIRSLLAFHPNIIEGEPWYQGDHMVFVQNQVPALAFTTGGIMNLLAEIAHTEKDRPELVDPGKLVELAEALAGLARRLSLLYPK